MSIEIPDGLFGSAGTEASSDEVLGAIRGAAERYGVDPDTMVSLARRESSLDPFAQNPHSSAGGLFQFTDATWKDFGRGADKFDPEANADAAARMLRKNLDAFGGDYNLALAAHHVGPGKARQALTDASVGDRDVSTQEWLRGITHGGGPGGGARREEAGGDAEYDMLRSVADSFGTFNVEPETTQAKSGRGDFMRRFMGSFTEMQGLAGGAAAGLGLVGESLFGEGGASTALKTAGTDYYTAKMAEVEREAYDDWNVAAAAAQDGDLGPLVDWLQGAAGYAAGQGLQLLATGGMGALGGKLALSGAARVALGGTVRKTAGKIAEQQVAREIAQGATESVAKVAAAKALAAGAFDSMAARQVASGIGAGIATMGANVGMEGGDIFGTMIEEAQRTGRQITDEDVLRGVGMTLGAAGLETATDMLGLGVLTGKIKIPGVRGRLARGAAGAAIGAPTEYGTEYAQTLMENYGATGESPFTEQSLAEAHAAGMQGLVGGTLFGGGAGLVSPTPTAPGPKLTEEDKAKAVQDLAAAPDVDTAVEAFQRSVKEIGLEDPIQDILAETPGADLGALVTEAHAAVSQWRDQLSTVLREEAFVAPDDIQAYLAQTTPEERTRDLLTADQASYERVLSAMPAEQQDQETTLLARALDNMPSDALRAAGGYVADVAIAERNRQAKERAFAQAEAEAAGKGAKAAGQKAREAEQGILEPTRDLAVEQAVALTDAAGINAAGPTAMEIALQQARPDAQAARKAAEVQKARGLMATRQATQTRLQQAQENEQGVFSAERRSAPLSEIEALEETAPEDRGPGTVAGRPAAEFSDAELREAYQGARGQTRNAIANELYFRGLPVEPGAPVTESKGPATESKGPVTESKAAQTGTPGSVARTAPTLEEEGPVAQGQDAEAVRIAQTLKTRDPSLAEISAAVVPPEEATAASPDAAAAGILARLFKKDIVWWRATEHAADGTQRRSKVGGFVAGQANTIYLNADSAESLISLVSHEILHLLKNSQPEAYRAIRDKVKADFDAHPEKFAQFKAYYRDAQLSDENMLEEAIADALGNQARDPAFWANVFARVAARHGTTKARSIITRLRDAIVRLISKAVSELGGKQGFENYITNLEDISGALEEAAAKYVEATRTSATAEPAGETRFTPAREGPSTENTHGREAPAESGRPENAPVRGSGAGRTHRGEIPSYGSPREGASSVVGTHYSTAERRTLLGAYYGRGLKGAEAARLQNADPRIRLRSHFYVDSGQGTFPEAGVGSHAHEVRLDNIYDLDADSLKLHQRDSNATELAILEAGFDGYMIRSFGKQGAVVVLGDHAIPVQKVGMGPLAPSGRTIAPPVLSAEKQLVKALVAAKGLPAGQMEASRWGRLLEATHPEIFKPLNEAGIFEGDEKLYKDELAGMYLRQARERFSVARTPGSDAGHKRTKAGAYVGAPAGMTPGKLAQLRKRLRTLVLEGEPGRYWYEDSSKAILAASEGDVARAEKLAGLLAIYSPNAAVSPNTTMALKALYQWLAGEPINARMAAQDAKAQAWMDETLENDKVLQIKTGNFFRNLMRKIDEDRFGFEKQGATIDMWMARVFGYGSSVIGSARRYTFAETEIKRLAKELGWEPQQVQAALWVSIKSRIEEVLPKVREEAIAKGLLKSVTNSVGNKSWVPVNGEAREAYEGALLAAGLQPGVGATTLSDAAYDFSRALEERIGQIGWEAQPGNTTGILPGIFDAPLAQQAEYLQAIDAALRDENGVDLIAKKLGLPVLSTAFGPSAWEEKVGAGAQTKIVVGTTRTSRTEPSPEGKHKIVLTPETKRLINAYAAIRGLVLNQKAVVWHYPLYDRSIAKQNGVEITFGRDLGYEDMDTLYSAITKVAGHSEWAPSFIPGGGGVRVLNFTETPNKVFQEKIKLALSKLPASFDGWKFSRFASDGDYIFNDWEENPNGEGYRPWISGAGPSGLQEWADSELSPRVEIVNRHFSEKYGWGRATRFSGERAARPGEPGGREELYRNLGGGRPEQGWLGATRIRRKDGRPLGVFRGAGVPLGAEHFGHAALGIASGNPSSGLGVWFTANRGEAQRYGAVAEYALDLRQPKYIKVEDLPRFDSVDDAQRWAQKWRQSGHDGFVIDARHLGGELHFVAFAPNQVKVPATPAAQFSSARLARLKDTAVDLPTEGNIDALAEALEQEPSVGFAVQGDLPAGGFALLGPDGHAWRLTRYDAEGLPESHTTFEGKREGIDALLEAVDLETLRDSMASFSAPRFPGNPPATLPPQLPPPKLAGQVLDWLAYKFQDKHRDLKALIKSVGTVADKWNAYLQEELFHGRAARATHEFVSRELRPLLEDMKARGVALDEFETYLHNRHAEERNAQIAAINPGMPDGGSGIDTADARAYLAGLPAARRGALEALARRIDAINAETRKLLVDYGLEKQSTIDAWESAYQKYVPLFRDMGDSYADQGGMGTGAGFSVKGSASKRATGSSRPVENILANLALQRERTITRGEKNRVAQALYGLALQHPSQDFWAPIRPGQDPRTVATNLVAMGLNPVDARNAALVPVEQVVNPATGLVEQRPNLVFLTAPNVLAARFDGETRYLAMNANDPVAGRMVASLKNLDVGNMGEFWGALNKVTRWFSAINTQYNPIFGVVNLVRDLGSAALNLSTTPLRGHTAEISVEAVSALRGIMSDLRADRQGKGGTSPWSALWEEFQEEGGQTGYRDMFRTAEDRAGEIEKEFARLASGKAMTSMRWAAGILSDYNETMENAVRLAAYKKGKALGLSQQQAASVAKNLTVNFNRKGQLSAQTGSLFAFFNASVQGTARIVETLKGPAGKKILAGGLLLGFMQAMLLAAMGYDDDDIPEFVKERSLVFPLPGTNKKFLTLPMPLGFHVIPNLGRFLGDLVLGRNEGAGKSAVKLFGLLIDAFNPIGASGLTAQTVTPTALDPVVALAENKDWTGSHIAKEDFNSLKPTPGHTRAKDTATLWSRGISHAINFMTGGTEYKKGAISPTPDQVDYLFGQLTGGVGRELSNSAQMIEALATDQDLPPHKIPLLGRFYGNASGPTAQGPKFYAAVTRLNEHEAQLKGLRAEGDVAGVRDYLAENPEARLVAAGNAVETRLTQLRHHKRELAAAGAERERIKAVEEQITLLMTRFNEKVRAVGR